MHCASLGEFEQGRPVLEALRQQYPECKIVLSFFSPSGYEVRKAYPGADYISYLPLDGHKNARLFLDLVQPKLALFVKYEFWHYYLTELQARSIPTVLVSGAFRNDQIFFKWYGGFFRKMLKRFTLLTVQNRPSKELLERIGFAAEITGDTRYDRVVAIAMQAEEFILIEKFKAQSSVLIAGSSWPEDEIILQKSLSSFPENWKVILAPHEIDAAHLHSIKALFGDDCIFYSEFSGTSIAKVLVIDNIGMLSSLYRYGDIAYVGGGFNKGGIHNVLEPAVFGLPVVFGPVFGKFPEAVDLVENGFAFSVVDAAAFKKILAGLMADEQRRCLLQASLREHVKANTGATSKVMALIEPLC